MSSYLDRVDEARRWAVENTGRVFLWNGREDSPYEVSGYTMNGLVEVVSLVTRIKYPLTFTTVQKNLLPGGHEPEWL